MVSNALTPANDTNPAYVTCDTGQVKILGPNKKPSSYPSYDSYINELNTSKAPLSITTDTPTDAHAITFTGSFMNAVEGTDPIISLKANNGDTLVVLKSQFTSQICYECDGGTLLYNGKEVNQNQKKLQLPKRRYPLSLPSRTRLFLVAF